MTFDAWERSIRPSNDYLAYSGIPGMKHGRHRYQNADGTWTEEGLRRRRLREGWGEGKEDRRAQKAIVKAEKKEARKASRAAAAENIRKRKLKNLTNEELQAKIDRLKKEKEYKELKKSPYVELGAKLIGKYLDYKDAKNQQIIEQNRQKIELKRLETQKIQATESTKKAKYESMTARSEVAKKRADVKGGLKTERQAQLQNAKTNYRNTTIWGSIGKRANNRAKFIQENRMNALEVKKHQRTAELQKLQIEREKEKTKQERAKARAKNKS